MLSVSRSQPLLLSFEKLARRIKSPLTRLKHLPSTQPLKLKGNPAVKSQAPRYRHQRFNSDLLVGSPHTFSPNHSSQLHLLRKIEKGSATEPPVRAWIQKEPSFFDDPPSNAKMPPLASFTVAPTPPKTGTEFDVYSMTQDTTWHASKQTRQAVRHPPTHVLKLTSVPRASLISNVNIHQNDQLGVYTRKRHVDAFFNQPAQQAGQAIQPNRSVRDVLKTDYGVEVLPLQGLYQGRGKKIPDKEPAKEIAAIQPHLESVEPGLKPLPSLFTYNAPPEERTRELNSYGKLKQVQDFLTEQNPIRVRGETLADSTTVLDDVGAQNVYTNADTSRIILTDMGSFRKDKTQKAPASPFRTILGIKTSLNNP